MYTHKTAVVLTSLLLFTCCAPGERVTFENTQMAEVLEAGRWDGEKASSLLIGDVVLCGEFKAADHEHHFLWVVALALEEPDIFLIDSVGFSTPEGRALWRSEDLDEQPLVFEDWKGHDGAMIAGLRVGRFANSDLTTFVGASGFDLVILGRHDQDGQSVRFEKRCNIVRRSERHIQFPT